MRIHCCLFRCSIIEQIKNKKNKLYECEIMEEKIDKFTHFKFIKLKIDESESQSFLVEENTINLTEQKIRFDVNSLKIKIINGIPYFLIEKFNLLDKDYNIKGAQLLIDLESDSYKIITSNTEIKPNYLYTLILRAKEIKEKTQKYKFELEDSNNIPVKIDKIENLELENKKIYYLHGYIYNISTLKLEKTNISYLEECSSSMLKMYNLKDISTKNINSLLNFKGKVESFNITDQVINIKDENKNNFKINVNYHLMKQISLNNECSFFNFIKKSNKEFIFTNLSFIEAKDETFIDFNFPFYDSETKYYNKIKINGKYYDLNNKNIKINIEDKDKNNLFLQKVSYERIIDEQTLDSYEFDLELDKGKIYHLDSSSEKNGFSYEIYIQSINENNLPNYLTVEFKHKKFVLNNPDKNGNRFKERFVIINFPKQDIKTILGLSENNTIIDDYNNYKYLLMIDCNNNKILKQFKKRDPISSKDDFYVSDETEYSLEKVSEQCHYNFIENIENKLYNIDENNIKKFTELMYEIYNGFLNFKFENTKRHYKIIKDIVSFSLNLFKKSLLGKYYSFRKNYEILLDSMLNLEYIDRIKILISFMVKFMNSIEEERICYDMFYLVDIDDINSYKNFPYVKDAFGPFYKIIDDLTEDCPLFHFIHQFNSIIYKDCKSGDYIHSGSILNINDIKLELIKNINRFVFVSEKSSYDCEEYANFEKTGLVVTFNIFSFLDNEKAIFDEINFKKETSIILFLLFHECLGHQKKFINNEDALTPRRYFKSDFKDFIYEDIDTGDSLEIMLLGKIANIKYLMKSPNSEKLLDPSLYTGKDFTKLQEIYSLIEKDNAITNKNKEINNNQMENNNQLNVNKALSSSKEKKSKKKEKLMYPELFQLFSGINDEQKEELKDNEDYQRYLKICKKKHQKPKPYLKKEDLFSLIFGQKK